MMMIIIDEMSVRDELMIHTLCASVKFNSVSLYFTQWIIMVITSPVIFISHSLTGLDIFS
jgi:hypothetical protein